MLLRPVKYISFSQKLYPIAFFSKTTKPSRYLFLNKYGAKKIESINTTNEFYKHKTVYNFNNYLVQKLPPTSNASRSTFYLKSLLPLHFLKVKKFFTSTTSSRRGRSKEGILCRTKGSVLYKHRYPLINLNFRTLSLSFIGGYYSLPLKLKTLSFVISASGETCYIPTTSSHDLFQVSKFTSSFVNDNYLKHYLYLSPFIKIPQISYLI